MHSSAGTRNARRLGLLSTDYQKRITKYIHGQRINKGIGISLANLNQTQWKDVVDPFV